MRKVQFLRKRPEYKYVRKSQNFVRQAVSRRSDLKPVAVGSETPPVHPRHRRSARCLRLRLRSIIRCPSAACDRLLPGYHRRCWSPCFICYDLPQFWRHKWNEEEKSLEIGKKRSPFFEMIRDARRANRPALKSFS